MDIAVVTNSSYITPTTQQQVFRLNEECLLRGIKLIQVSNSKPWSYGESTYMPDKCIYLDKDICYATELERRGIRLYNSARSIELADNKIMTQLALCSFIAFPKTLFAPKRYLGEPSETELDAVEREIGYPIIIKEAFGSLGKQVYMAKNRQDLRDITSKIGALPHLYQTAVTESFGRSLRVYVVGNKVIGAVRYINTYDFRSNMEEGGKACLAKLGQTHTKAAIDVAKAMGLDFCAVDFFDIAQPLMIEVNSNAYYKGLESEGINVTSQIIDYISKN